MPLRRRWRDEAVRNGCKIERIVVAYEAGRDGFWLARWLQVHAIETYVIHSNKRGYLTRESAGQDGSARTRNVVACVHRLAAW
jgi:hypothetical protein